MRIEREDTEMTGVATPGRTTEPFREEHVAIKEHLRHMSQMID